MTWSDSSADNVDGDSCIEDAVPPPPSPVLDVRLSDVEFSEREMEIEFLVQWSPPTTPNGQITHYLACLGGLKLDQFEEKPGSVEDGNDTTCQEIETVSSYIPHT